MSTRELVRAPPRPDWRRRRADRILEREYRRIQSKVLDGVSSSFRGRGVSVNRLDLEAAYNQAWVEVHGRILRGERIDNLVGLLRTVTSARYVDLLRQSHSGELEGTERMESTEATGASVSDEIADATMLRDFLSRVRGRLTREEAAALQLCWFHQYPRAEAAELMGLDDRRIQKVMDQATSKASVVANEVWGTKDCEELQSMMTAYAFGILAVDGPRYTEAHQHYLACAGCRRKVDGMRRVDAILPPIALPLALAGVGAGAMVRARLAAQAKAAAHLGAVGHAKAAGATMHRGFASIGAKGAAVAAVGLAGAAVGTYAAVHSSKPRHHHHPPKPPAVAAVATHPAATHPATRTRKHNRTHATNRRTHRHTTTHARATATVAATPTPAPAPTSAPATTLAATPPATTSTPPAHQAQQKTVVISPAGGPGSAGTSGG